MLPLGWPILKVKIPQFLHHELQTLFFRLVKMSLEGSNNPYKECLSKYALLYRRLECVHSVNLSILEGFLPFVYLLLCGYNTSRCRNYTGGLKLQNRHIHYVMYMADLNVSIL